MNQAKPLQLPFKPEDFAAYTKLLPFIRIMRAIVVSSTYSRDEIIDLHPDLNMQVQIDNQVTAFNNFDVKQAWCLLDISLQGIPTDEQFKDRKTFLVQVRLEIRYEAPEANVNPDEWNRGMTLFCHTSSPSHGWSFLRQHIMDAMNRMGLNPLPLPLLASPSPAPIITQQITKDSKTTTKKGKSR